MGLPSGLAALAQEAPATPIGLLLAKRPDLRAVVARVQSAGDLAYAELRQNCLAQDFTPFAACRLLLALYGMEKFDPRPPRSTKGALLQGAPLADEIVHAVPGEWSFRLVPALSMKAANTPRAPLRALESPEVSVTTIKQLAAKGLPEAREPTHLSHSNCASC